MITFLWGLVLSSNFHTYGGNRFKWAVRQFKRSFSKSWTVNSFFASKLHHLCAGLPGDDWTAESRKSRNNLFWNQLCNLIYSGRFMRARARFWNEAGMEWKILDLDSQAGNSGISLDFELPMWSQLCPNNWQRIGWWVLVRRCVRVFLGYASIKSVSRGAWECVWSANDDEAGSDIVHFYLPFSWCGGVHCQWRYTECTVNLPVCYCVVGWHKPGLDAVNSVSICFPSGFPALWASIASLHNSWTQSWLCQQSVGHWSVGAASG